MDRFDAELILVRWDEDASDEDKRAATAFGLAHLRSHLDLLETDLPALTAAAANGDFDPREVTHQQAARDVAVALRQWVNMCPEPVPPWQDIEVRARAVLAAFVALHPAEGGARHIALEGSPVAVLVARTAAELADGSIPYGCAHPVTADHLALPERIFRCAECHENGRSSYPAAGACACCGAPCESSWTMWPSGSVIVIARICVVCEVDGNPPALQD
jgi:hypothetical protein